MTVSLSARSHVNNPRRSAQCQVSYIGSRCRQRIAGAISSAFLPGVALAAGQIGSWATVGGPRCQRQVPCGVLFPATMPTATHYSVLAGNSTPQGKEPAFPVEGIMKRPGPWHAQPSQGCINALSALAKGRPAADSLRAGTLALKGDALALTFRLAYAFWAACVAGRGRGAHAWVSSVPS